MTRNTLLAGAALAVPGGFARARRRVHARRKGSNTPIEYAGGARCGAVTPTDGGSRQIREHARRCGAGGGAQHAGRRLPPPYQPAAWSSSADSSVGHQQSPFQDRHRQCAGLLSGKTVGAVQKVEVSPEGKPTKVSVALIGAKERIVVLDARPSAMTRTRMSSPPRAKSPPPGRLSSHPSA